MTVNQLFTLTKKKVPSSLPELFHQRLNEIFGLAKAREISRTFIERPTSLRVNTAKAEVNEVLQSFAREGFKLQRVPWSRHAFVLMNKSKRDLVKLPAFKEGRIYLQSLASQVPPLVLDPQPGERVLDMTAAPGSKTSQIAALMGAQGQLIAWEKDKLRFERLAHNMKLLSVQDFVELVRGDSVELARDPSLKSSFDRILLDAPCSAEVRFIERERATYSFWKEERIADNAKAQLSLICAAWKILKPGGTLVYSTCTFAPEENECLVAEFLRSDHVKATPGRASVKGLNFMPGLAAWRDTNLAAAAPFCKRIVPTNMIEGFFVASFLKSREQ